MALARVKSWIAEVLTYSDLNAEFNNILNNANSLISPFTANVSAGSYKLTSLAAATTAGDALRYEQVLGTGNKAIGGLTYDNGTDATNDLNINTGGAMDATGIVWMSLTSALGKQSDVAWSVGGTTGTPAGGLDTGAVGNNDYYIWLIKRSDTGVVDALFSLSSTAPTMPTSYDYKRLIGWFKRTGGTIVAFKTYEIDGGGIELSWNVPTRDINLAATLTTTRRTDAVKVPLNFSVIANLSVYINDAATTAAAMICCPDLTDAAVGTAPETTNYAQPVANVLSLQLMKIRTSAAGLIASRADVATVDNYYVSTHGFAWARRN